MDTPALMWRPGAKIKGCGSALIKHLLADLINSSKHFTFSGVIATEISNFGSINNKFCSSLDYIDAAYQRVRDINNSSASTKILNDLTYMIQTQKIYSGGFGFANINYSDKPTGASNWGYIEFFKHADNYVTVKYYQDGNAKVYIGQFILGESNWKIVWS